eukprot:1157754-Pelagomonas_calceolata.AAC.12
MGCRACCGTYRVSRRNKSKEEKKKKKKKKKKKLFWHGRGYPVQHQNSLMGLEVVLRQPIITSYVCVNQACSPRAFAKSFDDHSSRNIDHAGDDKILAA